MTGIVFFATTELDRVIAFYRDQLDAEIWLEQPDCTILQLDNQLIGFCERETADTDGIVTLVVEDPAAVDAAYEDLEAVAESQPDENENYDIYHFYATDPDGRAVEVQAFYHETAPIRW